MYPSDTCDTLIITVPLPNVSVPVLGEEKSGNTLFLFSSYLLLYFTFPLQSLIVLFVLR